jgi:hypothetical protein
LQEQQADWILIMLLKQQKVNGDLYTDPYKAETLMQEDEKEVEKETDMHIL